MGAVGLLVRVRGRWIWEVERTVDGAARELAGEDAEYLFAHVD